MSLDPLRDALLEAARAEAARIRDEAEQEARARVAEARRHAEERVARARHEGRSLADEEMARAVARARRHAHQQVLGAQREALEELRRRSVDAILARRDTPQADALLDRLAAVAEAQLGGAAEVAADPDGRGGLVASVRDRRVDYTVPALVDRCIEALGEEVATLWR